MTSGEINAIARAGEDYDNGMSWADNPYPVGTDEYTAWQHEMNDLVRREMHDELRKTA